MAGRWFRNFIISRNRRIIDPKNISRVDNNQKFWPISIYYWIIFLLSFYYLSALLVKFLEKIQMNVPLFWRGQRTRYGLIGELCHKCEKPIFPPRDVCPHCSEERQTTLSPEVQGQGPNPERRG